MRKPASSGGLVYSTEGGRMCPTCRRPTAQCSCRQAAKAAPAGDGAVRVWRETKGRGGKAVTVVRGLALDGAALIKLAHRRGGKAVTVVRGLALDGAALIKLAQQLKAACGSGGTVKDGTIEVQGDHADKIVALLVQQGHAAKRAGG